MNDRISFLRRAGVALAGTAALVAFSSCNDEEKPAEGNAPAQAAVAPASSSTEARDALFDDLLFGVGKRLTAAVTDRTFTRGIPSPECWNEMCGYLEKLEAYREELAKQAPGSLKLARVSVRVGQLRGDLMSAKALDDFDAAMKDYEALGDADKKSAAGKKVLCEIKEGKAAVLLGQKKSEDAFPFARDAHELRKEMLLTLVPKDDDGSANDEVADAAVAYFRTVSTLAVCKANMEDPEGAREVVKGCSEFVQSYKLRTPRMIIQYARVMSNLGDIERVSGDAEAALRAWREAAGYCAAVAQQNKEEAQRSVAAAGFILEAQSLYSALSKAIKSAGDELVGDGEGEEEPSGEAAPAETEAEPEE